MDTFGNESEPLPIPNKKRHGSCSGILVSKASHRRVGSRDTLAERIHRPPGQNDQAVSRLVSIRALTQALQSGITPKRTNLLVCSVVGRTITHTTYPAFCQTPGRTATSTSTSTQQTHHPTSWPRHLRAIPTLTPLQKVQHTPNVLSRPAQETDKGDYKYHRLDGRREAAATFAATLAAVYRLRDRRRHILIR